MKNKTYKITKKDAEILDMDFKEYYADYLKKRPAELKSYIKRVIAEYNKTRDAGAFFEALKTIAMAEQKMTEVAKNAKLERSTVYKLLSKKANPSFISIVSVAGDLGINFNAQFTGR